MMQLADLAVVSDANAVLDELTPDGSGPATADADVDVIVVGAGPAGLVRGDRARPRRALGRARSSGARSRAARTCTAASSTRASSTGCIPTWWEEAPIQRWVTRRSTMMLTADPGAHRRLPHRGLGPAAVQRRDRLPARLRPLAGRQGRGRRRRSSSARRPPPGCCATRTARSSACAPTGPTATSRPTVVIACDGVNSFLAKEAGLYRPVDAGQLHARREGDARPAEGGDRRALRRARPRRRRHRDRRLHGRRQRRRRSSTPTSTRSPSASCSSCRKLAAQQRRPEEIIADLKAHPAIAPLVEGGELKEYSAHLIPEAGLAMMPQLTGDGMLVAGDAAALCLAAGIWLEGVNFAMASGMYAGEAAVEALRRRRHVARRARRLPSGGSSATFVLRDHRKLRRAPAAGAVRPGAAPLPAARRRTSSSACSGSTTRSRSRACAGS